MPFFSFKKLKKMYGILFLFLAMFCQNPNHHTRVHHSQSAQVNALDDDDNNDDSGHIPPVPPKPPTNP
jgi:hypothetical protein